MCLEQASTHLMSSQLCQLSSFWLTKFCSTFPPGLSYLWLAVLIYAILLLCPVNVQILCLPEQPNIHAPPTTQLSSSARFPYNHLFPPLQYYPWVYQPSLLLFHLSCHFSVPPHFHTSSPTFYITTPVQYDSHQFSGLYLSWVLMNPVIYYCHHILRFDFSSSCCLAATSTRGRGCCSVQATCLLVLLGLHSLLKLLQLLRYVPFVFIM